MKGKNLEKEKLSFGGGGGGALEKQIGPMVSHMFLIGRKGGGSFSFFSNFLTCIILIY